MTDKNNSQQKKKNGKKPPLNDFIKYSALATQMIVIILAGVFGGMKADEYFNTEKPYFTALMATLSVFVAMYFAIKDFLKK